MVPSTAPKWADKLLSAFLPPDLAEELQGDMYEQFEAQVEELGLTKARLIRVRNDVSNNIDG